MHHANVLIGSREWASLRIPESERIAGPDVLYYAYDRMSIADVRALIYEAGLRPIAREHRTFIVSTYSLLHEAQNALLKLFEEPNDHTVFFLIIPREDILLPTLRSRMNLLESEISNHKEKSFELFKKADYAERLQMITKNLGDEDTVWVAEIMHGLSSHAHEKRDPVLMRDVLLLESYIYTNGSSKKMLLEHIALTLTTGQ